MSLTLHLLTANDEIHAVCQNTTLATTADLPGRAATLADPYSHGPALFAALGGHALLARLDADPDRLLYLDIAAADPADAVPWECAILPPQTFLVHRYGLLRLVDRAVQLSDQPAPLRLLAQGADALVDNQGRPTETPLDILREMSQIARVLAQSGQEVLGERIAPTPEALRAALSNPRYRTLLHLSCHGGLIDRHGSLHPVLYLEDDSGGPARLWGDDLISFTTLADLRLVLLSACRLGQKAANGYSQLTRALVENGVPAAVGMQGPFPDHLSDDLAAALYGSLLGGQPLGKALQAARLALHQVATAVGLPVAYVARGGDAPLPLQPGRPTLRLDLSQRLELPPAVQPPDPLLGRNAELHDLARQAQTAKVITIAGTGGMGKTALAAAYARRFGWRYADGIWATSFASAPVDDGAFRRELLRRLIGDELADESQEKQEAVILAQLQQRDLLLLIDNYESVQQALEGEDYPPYAAARRLHGLLAKIAQTGGQLLLTSRQQPSQLAGEIVFPGRDRPLQGVAERAAAQLFYRHSPLAKEQQSQPAIQRLARDVGRVTAGHPLAIALLGSQYDHGQTPATFLDHWEQELLAARSRGLDLQHATLAVAFGRSFNALSPAAQRRLKALSHCPFPFFAAGAAMLWDAAADDADGETRERLRELTDRSLIEIDIFYRDDTAATWRFQPAVRQEVARYLTPAETAQLQPRLAGYAAWLSRKAYSDIHQEGNTALVRLVRPTLDLLAAAAAHLEGAERLWHLRRVGWLLNAFGRAKDAYALLTAVLPQTDQLPDEARPAIRSSLLYEIANLEVTHGDLDRALALYQESLAFLEQIGDIQGKAASLSMMAQVFLTRGDLDRALALYQESLAVDEQIGDIQGKAASLHAMAQVFLTRGDLDRALALYQESLAVDEQIGDIQGKAASLSMMAQVFLTRGDLDRALALYQESLAVEEQIGDIQGKAASLHAMAQVFLTRGDLDRALALYQESLALKEQIGDIQGKAASLSMMAQVFLTRGDLDRALALYQESLALKEQIGDIQGKAASLSMMAQVFLTRGDLDRALALYQESLALKEQIGDIQGKAASLSMMAQVFLTRGDLDRALALYQESLALKEQIGDIQGKAASLSMMAQVFLTRGDLDRALALYQESLAFLEQIGDIQGKAASLSMMAQVFLTRGDLDRALALYQESLAFLEQIGDIQGKAASLSGLANLYMQQEKWEQAERAVLAALELSERLGELEGIAFKVAKLGQIAAARQELTAAQSHFQKALAIFRQLGMGGEAQQVAQMLADLGGPDQPETGQPPRSGQETDSLHEAANQMRQAIAQARAAAERQQWPAAISRQQTAVAHARALAQAVGSREDLVQLSVLLYNLAGYCQQAGGHAEAVAAYAEVVALDEQTGHEDLAADRQALAEAKQLAAAPAKTPAAALPPALGLLLAQLPSPIAQLMAAQWQAGGPDDRDQLLGWLARTLALPPDEREATFANLLFALAEASLLPQLAELVQSQRHQPFAAAALAQAQQQLAAAANQLLADRALGEQRHALVALVHSVAQFLSGLAAPAVPARYAAEWAAWQETN